MAEEKITTDDANQTNVENDNVNQEKSVEKVDKKEKVIHENDNIKQGKSVEKEDKEEEKVVHVPIILAHEARDEDEEGEGEKIRAFHIYEPLPFEPSALVVDPEEIWASFDDLPNPDDIITPEFIRTIKEVVFHMKMGLPDDLSMYDE